MKTPELMPILSAGAHASPAEGACIMEYASLLAGEEWTDHPKCTHPVLATAARHVNDWLGDEARQDLLPLLPRLMGTTSGDKEVTLRLAIFAARYVLPLVPGKYRASCERAISAATDIADGAGTEGAAARAASAAFGGGTFIRLDGISFLAYSAVSASLYVADGKCFSATRSAVTAIKEATVYSATTEADRIAFLTALIDEYDRLTGRGEVDPLTESDLKILQEATK